MALKFLLHLVGDLHNRCMRRTTTIKAAIKNARRPTAFRPRTLHHYWDTEFVEQLGLDPKRVAAMLTERISGRDAKDWARGGPAEWAMESFQVATERRL